MKSIQNYILFLRKASGGWEISRGNICHADEHHIIGGHPRIAPDPGQDVLPECNQGFGYCHTLTPQNAGIGDFSRVCTQGSRKKSRLQAYCVGRGRKSGSQVRKTREKRRLAAETAD